MNYLIESVLITLLFIVLLPGVFLNIKKRLKLNIIAIHALLFFVILFLINILFYVGKEGLESKKKRQKNPLDQFRVFSPKVESLVIRQIHKLDDYSDNSLVKWLDTNEYGVILAIHKRTATFLKNEDVDWTLDDSYNADNYVGKTKKISLSGLFDEVKTRQYIEAIRLKTLNKKGHYKETRKPYVGEKIGIKKNTKLTIISPESADMANVKNFIEKYNNTYKTKVNIPDYTIENVTSPVVTKVDNTKRKVDVEFTISIDNVNYAIEATLNQADIVDNFWLFAKTVPKEE